jgi:hypothetical protein
VTKIAEAYPIAQPTVDAQRGDLDILPQQFVHSHIRRTVAWFLIVPNEQLWQHSGNLSFFIDPAQS